MSFLSEILEVKRDEINHLRKHRSFSYFRDSEFFGNDRISLFESLNTKNGIGLIAEIKKASPSKGILRAEFNHMKIADIYLSNDVAGISVLTDKNFFKGDIAYLRDIAKIKSAPLLRKDFILDEFQIWEAKSNGADAVLLICEILSENQISELTHAAGECGLEVLLELHSMEQIPKIDFKINRLIGVNNRDLKTFEVSIDTTLRIADMIPENATIISESGFNNKTDVEIIKSSKVKSILAGEHFMKAEDINKSVNEFLEWCSNEG